MIKKLAWIVLPLAMLGCATASQPPPVVQNVAVEEIMNDTVRNAALTDKLRVATYGGYRVSARRVKQTSPDCWIVHKRVLHLDRVADVSDVEVCHQ